MATVMTNVVNVMVSDNIMDLPASLSPMEPVAYEDIFGAL
jgi:hypothetical protein